MPTKTPNLSEWKKLVETINKPKEKTIEIAIVGKYKESLSIPSISIFS